MLNEQCRNNNTHDTGTVAAHHRTIVENNELWVTGKSEAELLGELRVFLAKLREEPTNLYERLRVAAIQLRLGRVDEAMVHYEGVIKGYAQRGQLLSAIALCERLLQQYPHLLGLKNIQTTLKARLPRPTAAQPAVNFSDTGEQPIRVTSSTLPSRTTVPPPIPQDHSTEAAAHRPQLLKRRKTTSVGHPLFAAMDQKTTEAVHLLTRTKR